MPTLEIAHNAGALEKMITNGAFAVFFDVKMSINLCLKKISKRVKFFYAPFFIFMHQNETKFIANRGGNSFYVESREHIRTGERS